MKAEIFETIPDAEKASTKDGCLALIGYKIRPWREKPYTHLYCTVEKARELSTVHGWRLNSQGDFAKKYPGFMTVCAENLLPTQVKSMF